MDQVTLDLNKDRKQFIIHKRSGTSTSIKLKLRSGDDPFQSKTQLIKKITSNRPSTQEASKMKSSILSENIYEAKQQNGLSSSFYQKVNQPILGVVRDTQLNLTNIQTKNSKRKLSQNFLAVQPPKSARQVREVNQMKKQEKDDLNKSNKSEASRQAQINNIFNLFPGKAKQNQTQPQITDEQIMNLLKASSTLASKGMTSSEGNIGYYKNSNITINYNQIKNIGGIDQDKKKRNLASFWLGQVFDRCVSSSFKLYIEGNLDYNETKTYCCQQILSNLLVAIKDGEIFNFPKPHETCSESPNKRQPKRSVRKVDYLVDPMKFINEQSSRILDYQCHKYPQSDTQGVNKNLADIVKTLKIDNWADDEYDLLRLSKVKFQFNQHGDYAKQIMQFLNFLIELPYQKHRVHEQLTNYKYFEKVMKKIFDIVNFKETKSQIQQILNLEGQMNLMLRSKASITEEQLQYREKVKKYTTVLIGCKIPASVKPYSEEELASGIIKMPHNSVARVIDKWAQQLSSKFNQPEKNILQRTYRFKSADENNFSKLQRQTQQKLFEILCGKAKKLEDFTKQLKQSLYDLSGKLSNFKDSDVSNLQFLEERQRLIGQFAVKMSQSSSQYFIQIIKKQIHFLLSVVEQNKSKWLEVNKFKQSPNYKALNIDLITFKIGDLMRCKLTSNEDQVIRVLKVFMTLSQMWDNKLIKIIRVKNRLESGTRDILINFMFDQTCPCQMQLAVAQKTTQKQQYFDKFNHFLYELKRAYLGPVMQMCKIWSQFETKSQTFAKQIQKSVKKRQKKKKLCEEFKNFDVRNMNQVYEYKFPFLCSSCQIYCPRNNLIFFNSLIKGKIYCGECTKAKLYLNQWEGMQQIKKMYLFKKYIMRYPNLYKLMSKIYQIRKPQQMKKHQFIINIPIKSRSIHLGFSMIVKIEHEREQQYEEFSYIDTIFDKQGNLQRQFCHSRITKLKKGQYKKSLTSMEELEQMLTDDYIFYGWSLPTQLLPLPQNPNEHYLQLIQKLLPYVYKLQQEKGKYNVKIAAVEVEPGRFYFIPFFVADQLKISEQVNHQKNMNIIHESLQQKVEILQISDRNITTQWADLSQNVRLQIAHTIKEIYLSKNRLKSIDFIEHLHVLKILHANDNQIQQIPNIPRGLQELKLDSNGIKKMNSFITSSNQAESYHLHTLNLCKNQIEKIENISELKTIKWLYLIYNKISKIEGLPSSVINLGLSFNNILKIENMDHLSKLKIAALAGNLITKIENLDKCTNIESLILNRNNIPKIQNLHNLCNLDTLHLSFTGLDSSIASTNTCSSGFYEGLRESKKLKRLIMEGNKIKCLFKMIGRITIQSATSKLAIDIENPYVELTELNLIGNELYSISYFQKLMPMVRTINVSQNNLKDLDNLTKFAMLSQFNASCNSIERMPQQGWQKLFKLTHLNLSRNQLKHIPNLRYLILLRNMNLSFNEITRVDGFPAYPSGYPDFSRVINLEHNRLFALETGESDFEATIQAMKGLNQQSDVDMTDNGWCPIKLGLVKQIILDYVLSKTKVQKKKTETNGL